MKRIICSILVVLLVLAILPLAAIAAEDLPADVNAAINAEGSNIVFSADQRLTRWTATQTETERYATLVSPVTEDDKDDVELECGIEMNEGDVFYIEVTPYMSNGDCDVDFTENGDDVEFRSDLEDGATHVFALKATYDRECFLQLEFDFDSYELDEPMYLRVGNAKVITADELPAYELTYVDYRTLETIDVETVKLLDDAKGLEPEQIPVHEGYVFVGYDDEEDMRRVTKDSTIYVKYATKYSDIAANEPEGFPVDISALPLPEGVGFSNGESYPWQAFSGTAGVFIRSSNQGADSSSSEFTLTLPEVTNNMLLSFEYYVSSEAGCDFIYWGFGQEHLDSGESQQWVKVTTLIDETMSNTSFEFSYNKDYSDNEGSDSAYIRNIELVDMYNVDYTYIDKYTGDVIESGEVEYGSFPPAPTYPTHEGMAVYCVNRIDGEDGSLTYEVYYRDDYNLAGNIEGGTLNIYTDIYAYENLSQIPESEYEIVTEGDREFLRLSKNQDKTYADDIRIDCDEVIESFTTPVLAFDYRARKPVGFLVGPDGKTSQFLVTPTSNEWQTIYYPIEDSESHLMFADLSYPASSWGQVIIELDNLRIIEGGEATVTYHLQNGEQDLTEQRVVPKYSRFDSTFNPFAAELIPAGDFFYGYTESIEYVTEDIAVHARCLPLDRSAVFADPSQTDIALGDVVYGSSIQLTPTTIDQRETLGAVTNVQFPDMNGLYGYLDLTINTCPKEYLAIDVKIGKYESVHLGEMTKERTQKADGKIESESDNRAAFASKRVLRDTGGEWATIYYPVVEGKILTLNMYKEIAFCNIGEPIESYVGNIRFVDSAEYSMVTFKDADTHETLGQFEYESGTLLSEINDAMELAEMLEVPEGKVIAKNGFVEPDSQIINGDVSLYIDLEDKINLDEALNNEGKNFEFENRGLYQWRVEQMDGRTVAVPHEYYSKNWSGEIDLRINVKPGDIFAFDYKFLDPNNNTTPMALYNVGGDYSNYFLEKTGEWTTLTYEITNEQLNFYFFTVANDIDIGEVAYDPEMVLALDNFRMMPGSCDATIRGTYGVTLGDLKDQLPEGWSWVDESIVPDVVNEGYEVTYEAPDSEKFYSSNPNPVKVEVIVLPIDLEGEPFTLTGLTTDGTLGSIELPSWLEWKNPDTLLTSFNVETEFEATVQREGIDPRNYIGSGETTMVKLTAYDMGDSDLNGEVTAADASEILRHIVKLITLDEFQQNAANVNRSEGVEAADAAMILRYIVRLLNTLHVTTD